VLAAIPVTFCSLEKLWQVPLFIACLATDNQITLFMTEKIIIEIHVELVFPENILRILEMVQEYELPQHSNVSLRIWIVSVTESLDYIELFKETSD